MPNPNPNPSTDAVRTPGVVVLGSVNLDSFYRVRALPRPGETVHSGERSEGLGGKGANQAIAAARAGAGVTFLGFVGNDPAGGRLRASLAGAGVDTSYLLTIAEAPSGSAVIVVDEAGENLIVVSGGANSRVSAEYVSSVGVRIAAAGGVRVVVNLAPFFEFGAALESADPLVLNETEAGQLDGAQLDGVAAALRAGRRLLDRCVSVVITLGSAGAVLITADDARHIAAPVPARVTDTTGAGDAFVGVLSAALAAAVPLHEAVVAATVAATLSVQTAGAAVSYPEGPTT